VINPYIDGGADDVGSDDGGADDGGSDDGGSDDGGADDGGNLRFLLPPPFLFALFLR